MTGKLKFTAFLMMLNAFFGGYAVGLNSRHIDVVDPKLPPLAPPKVAAPIKAAKKEASEEKIADHKSKHKKHEHEGKKGSEAHTHKHHKTKPSGE